MPGRAALSGIAAAKADIASTTLREVPSGAGDPVGEYSAIGGSGRNGADAYGSLSDPMFTRIDAQWAPGSTTKGQQGVGYGVGRTFGSGGSKRAED